MSVTFESVVTVPAERETVYDLLLDPDHYAEWMPGFVRNEILHEGREGDHIGRRWRETRKLMGHEGTEEFELVAVDRPVSFRIRIDGSKGSTGKGQYVFDYILAPHQDGTQVKMRGEIDMPGLIAKLTSKVFVGMMRKACTKDLEAFAAWVGERKAG